MRLYLASTSPARRALLAQAGITPVLADPGVDEDAAVAAEEERLGRRLSAGELVEVLAVAKALAVADREENASVLDGFVFGGDSAFEVNGHIYGKPHTPDVARARWHEMLQAGSGVLWSGHCVVDRRRDRPRNAQADAPQQRSVLHGTRPTGSWIGAAGDRVIAVDSARLTFADDLSAAEIDDYIATGEPLEVAGAFTIDGRAAAFIERIDGAPSAVIGLSLPVLRRMLLHGFGIRWTDDWSL